jgi:sulfite exporter TauE/SafE
VEIFQNLNHDNLMLFFSIISLGFFSGFTHCTGMCGPLVIAQVSNKLKNIKIENFSQLTRIKNCALIPYHFGRILTYTSIALISKLITISFDETSFYRYLSFILLIFVCLVFIKYFIADIKFFNWLNNLFNKLIELSNKKLKPLIAKNLFGFWLKPIYQKILSHYRFLFNYPFGINGLMLGIILGFLPCGLIYVAVAIAVNLSSLLYCTIAMILFGISTFPALFLTSYFGSFILKIKHLRLMLKFIFLLNIFMLIFLAFKQIS